MQRTTTTSYCVYSGKRAVGLQNAWSPSDAVVEYMRRQGYLNEEIRRMGYDSAAWRGATFTAREASAVA